MYSRAECSSARALNDDRQRDIDLQTLRFPNDTVSLREVAVQNVSIRCEDGVDFSTGEPISPEPAVPLLATGL